jgi:hypothetical protein
VHPEDGIFPQLDTSRPERGETSRYQRGEASQHGGGTARPNPRQPGPAPRHGGVRSALVASALCALLVGTSVIAEHETFRAEAQHRSAATQFRSARGALVTRTAIAENAVQSLAAPLAVAADILDSSADRVLDEAARTDLAIALASATLFTAHLRTDAARGRTILESTPGTATEVDALTPAELSRTTTRLEAAVPAPPGRVVGLGATLRSRTDATRSAVAAWQVEQDRLAAEAAAREAAAREAEEAARRVAEVAAADAAAAEVRAREREASATSTAHGIAPPAGAAPAPSSIPPPPPSHAEYVWTTGFQAELDACRGSVDMTPSFGTAVIGEHWSCGGSSFPRAEGSTVVLSGALVGTYRVGPVVAVLDQHVDRIEDVPQGYELLYQTCIDGDNTRMSFTHLIPAG